METTYVLCKNSNNCGYDMVELYFIQKEGNEKAIEKLKRINKTNMKFYEKNYKSEDLEVLKKMMSNFENMFDEISSGTDSFGVYIFSGKVEIPGDNKVYEEQQELEKWWTTYLNDPKYPNWKKYVENIYKLI